MNFPELLGNSSLILTLREQATRLVERQASSGRSPALLLQGETGTGKGLLARSLHRASPRRDGPFVGVNCAALPATLLEAELFGFERGAFTDARQAKAGLFQAADAGTLFLDEVNALPLDVQAKLLTALDDHAVRRLGSTRAERLDLWIIAAANDDLGAAVRTRSFRQDLWYRLSAVTLRLPPLRERGQDVLLLADEFLTRVCADYGIPAKRLALDARDALLRHAWPGNVRELANVIERAALLCSDDAIDATALALPDVRQLFPASALASADTDVGPSDYREALDRVERAQLLATLEATSWNISRAAEQLGVARNTLRYRIARHGLRPDAPTRSRRQPRLAIRTTAPARNVEKSAAPTQAVREGPVSFLRVAVPENAAHIVTLDPVVGKIEAFGGRVVRRTLGRVDGAFGVEPAEDTPGRAANAALAVRRLVERAEVDQPQARLRIAIETITCALQEQNGVIQLAPSALLESERVLDALIEQAQAGTIVVGARAAPHLERQFALTASAIIQSDHGPRQLMRRGGASESEPPGTVTFTQRRSPFVGRSQEVAFLQMRLRQVTETGRGHIVALMAEPGMGKSRLLAELARLLARESIPMIEGRCASHTTATPYALLLDVARRTWHLEDSDTSEALAGAIRRGLSAVGLDEGSSAAVILSLLGVGGEGLSGLSPEAIKSRAFNLFRDLFHVRARSGPVVLLFEDLHWADQTSREFLDSFADSLPGAPILGVVTTRPGHRASWLDRSWASQLALPPLGLEDSLVILSALRPDLASPAAHALARRAEGNPFFLEEIARAVSDGGSTDPVVPGTITDVIGARMDRLTPEPRRLLETAAVLGREAPLPLLEALTHTSAADLAVPLRELIAAEFLFEQPGPTFVFKHAITHDVAYERLSSADRAALHASVGESLERLYPGRTDEVLHALAHHWSCTDDHSRAVDYLRRLGDRAVAACAPAEALGALERALRKGEQLPEGPERERTVLSVIVDFPFPLILLGRIEEVKTLLLQYQPRVERFNDPALLGSFFASLAFPHDHTGDHRHAEALALRALESATRARDGTTMGKALMVLTLSSLWTGRFAEGIERADRAIEVLTAPGGASQWRGLTLWVKAHHEILLGHFDVGLRTGEALLDVGERTENKHSQSYGICIPGWVATLRGDIRAAVERCENALELASNPITRAVVMGYLGEALEATGRYREAREQLSGSVDLLRQINFPQCLAWNLTRLSAAERGLGDLQQAHVHADEASRLAGTIEFPYAEALAQRALGLVAQHQGDVDSALGHLLAALDALDRMGARYHAALVRVDLVAPFATTGTPDRAAASLLEAAGIFREVGASVWVRRTVALALKHGVRVPSELSSEL